MKRLLNMLYVGLFVAGGCKQAPSASSNVGTLSSFDVPTTGGKTIPVLRDYSSSVRRMLQVLAKIEDKEGNENRRH